MRLLLLVALAACGRIGFDPLGGDGSNGPATDGRIGDGAGSGSNIDAALTACDQAITVADGAVMTIDLCTEMDRLDGCGPAGAKDVVFKFTAPTTAGRNFAAYDTGTNNVSSSTGVVNAGCTATTAQCAGLLGTSVNAGQTLYLAVEATTCKTIDFKVF